MDVVNKFPPTVPHYKSMCGVQHYLENPKLSGNPNLSDQNRWTGWLVGHILETYFGQHLVKMHYLFLNIFTSYFLPNIELYFFIFAYDIDNIAHKSYKISPRMSESHPKWQYLIFKKKI
jgi:hypothetical protein